jgi:hypothetical protein
MWPPPRGLVFIGVSVVLLLIGLSVWTNPYRKIADWNTYCRMYGISSTGGITTDQARYLVDLAATTTNPHPNICEVTCNGRSTLLWLTVLPENSHVHSFCVDAPPYAESLMRVYPIEFHAGDTRRTLAAFSALYQGWCDLVYMDYNGADGGEMTAYIGLVKMRQASHAKTIVVGVSTNWKRAIQDGVVNHTVSTTAPFIVGRFTYSK